MAGHWSYDEWGGLGYEPEASRAYLAEHGATKEEAEALNDGLEALEYYANHQDYEALVDATFFFGVAAEEIEARTEDGAS